MSDSRTKSEGKFSEAEVKAMRDRAKELRAEEKANKKREVGEKAVLDAIAEMKGEDRVIGTKIHEIVSRTAPKLWPKTWYGMPAYAIDGKVVLFFQAAGKFESRYPSLGFNDPANLDNGNMWPITFALIKITEAEEKKIVELIKQAVG